MSLNNFELLLLVPLGLFCVYGLVTKLIGPPIENFPPGPKQRWLIGNLLDMPLLHPWVRFQAWSKLYGMTSSPVSAPCVTAVLTFNLLGDIVVVRLLQRHLIVLNSQKSMIDLLEKQGAQFANRPVFTMCGELVGFDRV